MRTCMNLFRHLLNRAVVVFAFTTISFAQLNPAPVRQPLPLTLTHYRLRAGEATRIVAPQDTRDFILTARDRRMTVGGVPAKGLVVSANPTGDEIVLGASLTTPPGEYSAELSATDAAGQERVVTLDVVLDPIETVPSNATKPPVVLLNGWQRPSYSHGSLSTCPISTTPPPSAGTFGGLQEQLVVAGVPAVYFFDNCREGPDAKIEDLGNKLRQFLALIKFDNGTTVPQIDLIGHSMGGLIARAYLAGLQSDGSLSLPNNPRIRKLIEIATPNFGSFLAPTILLGDQTHELVPGSAFLWNLGTWNQGGDDLRGVDALAIIGNAGSWNGVPYTSDGVVSLTSASLGFARDLSRTRILPYCHLDTSVETALFGVTCSGSGIANVDNVPETAQLVLAFLANALDTVSVGHVTPAQDPVLAKYGGLYFAFQTSAAQWVTDITAASLGSVALQQGYLSGEDFYIEFVNGTGTIQATSTSLGTLSCGPIRAPVGYYNVFRCKIAPQISSVGPLVSNSTAKIVSSGGTITIGGTGFGQQRCASCQVLAYPDGATLQVSSWSDQNISAALPAKYSGLVQLVVVTAAGKDSVNIVAASAPSISAGGVVNAASYAAGTPLAPGSIAAAFGSFPLDSPAGAQGVPLPTSLSGLSMQFGIGTKVPLFYAASGQVNFQVPWELAGQSQSSLTATVSGQSSAAQNVALAPFAPGIFSMNGQGTGQGAIVDALSGLLVDSSNPAIAGSTYLSIYCTGLGPVTNQPASGAAATSDPLSQTTTTPRVTVGGVQAQVLFAGLAPGFVGLYQVNVQVPAEVTSGNAVPVVIVIGGATSNTGTIAVKQPPSSQNPTPMITNLSPPSAAAGASALTLTINGTGFLTSSSVTFGGTVHTASFISSIQLSIVLTSTDLAAAGTYPVVVSNPAPGGGVSAPVNFSVTSPAPTLQSLSLSATSVTGGTSVTGTVRLSGPAPAGGAVISLRSSSCVVSVPTSVTLAATAPSISFVVTTVAVTSAETVTITASYGASSQTATLTVNPPSSSGIVLQGKGFQIDGTLTISGTTLRFEIQGVPSGASHLVTIDDEFALPTYPQLLVQFTSIGSISGNTATFSSTNVFGLYQSDPAKLASISSATLVINFTSSSGGSPVTGTLTLSTSSGTVQATFTGSLTAIG